MPQRLFHGLFHGFPVPRIGMAAEPAQSKLLAGKFSELLRDVRKGRTFLVTSHGKPVARVIPADDDSQFAAARSALFDRLDKQKPARGALARRRWTREELYEDPE